MSVKNPCRSHFTYSDRQSHPLYPSPDNGTPAGRGTPPPTRPFHQANGDIHEREEREYVGSREEAGHQKGQPIRLAFLFLCSASSAETHSGEGMLSVRFIYDSGKQFAFAVALVNYRATMLQLFGTSPSIFHDFNMAELTYSVPVVPTAVFLSH